VEEEMSTAPVEIDDMAKKQQKTTPVRLTEDAIKWARIASGYTGESVSEYLSRIAVEKGQDDAERLHSQVKASKPSKVKGELK
jgi:hypothetical protein